MYRQIERVLTAQHLVPAQIPVQHLLASVWTTKNEQLVLTLKQVISIEALIRRYLWHVPLIVSSAWCVFLYVM